LITPSLSSMPRMVPTTAALFAALSFPNASDAFAPASFGLHFNSRDSAPPLSASAADDSVDEPTPSGAESSLARRRDFVGSLLGSAAAAAGIGSVVLTADPRPARADAAAMQDSLDVNEFLRTGIDIGGPMGVSSQAGKSRPETGVILRDGSGVSRDSRSGDVLAEILLGSRGNYAAVLASFSSPWPLATGPVYDVECRDAKTGDGAFLAVTTSTGGRSVSDLPSSFFLDQLFAPTGRFSFYGAPTDVKVKKSTVEGSNRVLEVSFSNLSQSTQTEIPRVAVVSATIPEGSDQAVMLVGSATAVRWRKGGSEPDIRKTVASFRAVPAPKSSLKIRAKERGTML